MSWIYLPESAVQATLENSLETGEPSAMSNGINAVNKSSSSESKTESLTMPRSGEISVHSTGNLGLDQWISSRRVFLASHSALRESDGGNQMNGTCGLKPSESLAKYDPDSHSWKMSPDYLPQDKRSISWLLRKFSKLVYLLKTIKTRSQGDTYAVSSRLLEQHSLDEFSETFPKSGMIADGLLYPLPMSEHRTSEKGSGYWPTPTEHGNHNRKGMSEHSGDGLSTAVKKWPTPRTISGGPDCSAKKKRKSGHSGTTNLQGAVLSKEGGTSTQQTYPTPNARDCTRDTSIKRDRLPDMVKSNTRTGQLNPYWVEWLMGYPIGATDLKKLEMHGCQLRQWKRGFGLQKN